MKTRTGEFVQKKINYVVEEPEEEDHERWTYDFARVLPVGRVGENMDRADVHLTPTQHAEYQTKIPWTVDSGAPKTMLAERHMGWVLQKNQEVQLKRSNVRFRPYNTDKVIPLLGMCYVKLRNKKGKSVTTRIYVVEGETESLLGRQDAIDLGILRISPDGDEAEDEENRLRCITPEIFKAPITTGVVSGGKDQTEIDADMAAIADRHQAVYEGMGRARVEPIHIQMKEGAVPIAQGKRPIPIQFRQAVCKKLAYMKENGLIESPLPATECKGWIHNMVITRKSWSSEEVQINIDTKRMNKSLVHTKIPIPTTEELRHDLEGSDRFTALDCRDSFFHFLLDPASQELFKFHGPDGVYRFLVLVMGTPPVSGECHTAMSLILDGLKGVIVIKDSSTGEKPLKLMYGRDIQTKLPGITKTTDGEHHQNAREKNRQSKAATKASYEKKYRVKWADIKQGDKAYIKQKTTTKKGPWDPNPFTITNVKGASITGERGNQTFT